MIRSVAFLSMHTSPLLQPGHGSAGGMNVYVDELARTMADRDLDIVVFTRRTDPDQPEVVELSPGYRVVHVSAGPETEMQIAALPQHVPAFAAGVVECAAKKGARFDIVHSHYWLSGWAGVLVKEVFGIPLANSFHTLGRVKDLARRTDEPASGPMRTLTEQEVIAQSDCVIASTPAEFDDLLDQYGASPERLCISPPGVDHGIFHPGDTAAVRRRLDVGDGPIVLFVGRVEPLKGVDIAVEAMAQLPPQTATSDGPPHLVIIGGPSGAQGEREIELVGKRAAALGVNDRIHFVPAQPHAALAAFYQAADVLVMPSRSESFGLVAAEAQACGLPVVASAVGGLRFAVADGESGLLVVGEDPADYAIALTKVLGNRALALSMADRAVDFAAQFSWAGTADRLLELYDGISGR